MWSVFITAHGLNVSTTNELVTTVQYIHVAVISWLCYQVQLACALINEVVTAVHIAAPSLGNKAACHSRPNLSLARIHCRHRYSNCNA